MAAIVMPLFERHSGSEDFDEEAHHSAGELVGHALFLAAMGPSKFDAFAPRTAAGRATSVLHSFSLLLIISAYTANLAAQFTTTEPPVQRITDVASFSADAPLCVRSSSVVQQLLNASYPAVLASALPPGNVFGLASRGSRDALDAVLSGQCAGALLPATEAAWLLHVNDTRGELCALVPVGAPVGDEGVPLTFAPPGAHGRALTDAQLEALSSAIAGLHNSGDFLGDARAQFFPGGPRAACAVQDRADAAALVALSPAARLRPIDLAGAFLLQALGLALGFVFHCTKGTRKRYLRMSQPRGGAGDGSDPAAALQPAGSCADATDDPKLGMARGEALRGCSEA